MRAALHTLMFGSYPLHRVAPVAREIGYAGVALMCRPPHLDLDNPGPSARAGSQVLTDAGLQIVGLASGLGRPESFGGAPASAELDGVRRALEAANILDAGLLRLWGGADGMSVDNADDLAAAAAWYNQAATVAADAGVRVTIEVHAQGLASSTPATCRLVDAIDHPNLGAALDTGNLHAAATTVGADDVTQLGARIFDVHVKDMRGLPDAQGHTLEVDGRYYVHVPLGEGDVRNGETLRQLAAGGYAGWIANESECSWPDWDSSVSAAKHEFAELNELIQAAYA
ncbi:MAG: sugar phosphate isomerase/epimerase [Chloroflexi bacterium]|nr:sugar phosphate isomerase/epimerase [Chloroflexota bacterium]